MQDTEQEVAAWCKQHKVNRDEIRSTVRQARAAVLILDACLDELSALVYIEGIDALRLIRDKSNSVEDVLNEIIEREINASKLSNLDEPISSDDIPY